MGDLKKRRRGCSCLAIVLLVPVAAVLVLRFWGRPPAVGAPVDQVISEYGRPYYDSRAEKGDGQSRYTLFFSADNALGSRALYVRIEDDKVVESWFWSR